MKARESNIVPFFRAPAVGEKPHARTISEAHSLNTLQRAGAFSAIKSVVEASISTDQRDAVLAFAAATLEIDAANATHVATDELAVAFTTACMGGKVTLEGETRVKTIVLALGVQSH